MEVSNQQEMDFMLIPRSLTLDHDRHLRPVASNIIAPPGFVYICLDEEFDKDIIRTWGDCCICYHGKSYLSSEIIVDKFHDIMKRFCDECLSFLVDVVSITRQGPAVTLSLKVPETGNSADKFFLHQMIPFQPRTNHPPFLELNKSLPFININNPNKDLLFARPSTSLHSIHNFAPEVSAPHAKFSASKESTEGDCEFTLDLVLAIPCTSWPASQVSNFEKRINNAAQSSAIVYDIKGNYKIEEKGAINFHIVPKCSNCEFSNLSSKFEWRLSFSVLEKILFRDIQICKDAPFYNAFLALKNWKYFVNKRCNDTLSSYHLKTTYFWMLENISNEDYVLFESSSHAEQTANAFAWMIQLLTEFVQSKNMPHYFCNNINLFGEKSERDLDMLRKEIEKIRKTPLELLEEMYSDGSGIFKKDRKSLFKQILPSTKFRHLNARTGKRQYRDSEEGGSKDQFFVNILS